MKNMKAMKNEFGLLAVMALAVMSLAVTQAATSVSDKQPTSQAEYRELRWSPDGKSLAVVMRTDPKAHFRIAIIPAEGGEPRWLSLESPGTMMPRWSPDGRDIAFLTAGSAPLDYDLFVVSATGGATRRVASTLRGHPFQFNHGYTWTLDGKGFQYFAQAPEPARGHYTLDLSGKATRTPGTESIPLMLSVEWSVDQSKVAFTDSEPGVFVTAGKTRIPATRIYLADSHGENSRPVTGTGDLPQAPSWSPDGKTILYSLFRRPISGPTLWSISVDGKGNRSLAADGIRGQFSPDGRWIAYIDSRGTDSQANPAGSSFYKRVCKARLDGSGVIVIAH